MHATTDFFRGYCLFTTTFAWRSLTTGGTCITQPSRPRGRSHSQCCCVAFPGAVIAITTINTSSSFSHACACHAYIHVCMYVYLPKFKNKCTTTMIPIAVPWVFYSNNIICFRTKYGANLEIRFCQVFFLINLSIHQDPRNNWRVPFKIQNFARFSVGRRPSNEVI